MNRFTLTLDSADLEVAWWRDWAARYGAYQRVVICLLFVVVAGFSVVDVVAFGEVWPVLFRVRAGILLAMVPAIPAFFGSVETLARWGQLAVFWMAIVTLVGLWPMGLTIGAGASEEDLLFSVPTLLLVLLCLFGASGLRFAFAAPVGVGTMLGFAAALGPSEAATPTFGVLAVAGGFSGLAIGLMVCWSKEAHARRDFMARIELERERRRSDALLRNLMPDLLARRLAAGPGPHLDRVEATVVFATVVGFDAERYTPLDAVAVLDRVVGGIDSVALAAGVERIKTVGATVLLAAGVPAPVADHAVRAARLAIDLRREVARIALTEGVDLSLRVGVASGPLVAGVVGRTRYAFDVWGDTVNTASRLDTHGKPGRIQVSAATAALLEERFVVRRRGEIEVKGKGLLETFWLEGPKDGRRR